MSNFIELIAPAVCALAPQYGIKVASPIIAQAICESGWGETTLASQYHNYFGMKAGSDWKGRRVNMATMEEYTVGTLTQINDDFRAFDSVEEGVRAYFEFIQYPRYSNLKGVTDPYQYLVNIKNDGYATASNYVSVLWQIIQENNLTEWDKQVGKITPATPAQNTAEKPQNERRVVFCEGKPQSFDTAIYGDYNVVCDILNVRHEAGLKSKIMISIFDGTAVMCNGFYTEADGMKWYMIQFYGLDGTVYCGFASAGEGGVRYLERNE